MPKPVLAVGVDPAKRVHRAVAVLFPDEIVLDVAVPNSLDAVADLDICLADLAERHEAELVHGLEDHRRYGRVMLSPRRQVTMPDLTTCRTGWKHRMTPRHGGRRDPGNGISSC
jgi:hypothetical protein